MPTKAGQVVVDLTAGTSKFVVDIDTAKAKLREFGTTGVGEHKAVSAAMKALEGNFANNKRAADAFIATVLGGGPILKAAFPVVGALAFAGVIGEVGQKVQEFFKELKEGPEKAANAWRTLIQPIRSANDELDVANARLENDIAKLEGKRQNNLAVALAEAKVAADKLGESLEKDISSVNKLLKEQELSFFQGLFSGQNNVITDALKQVFGGETGLGGLYSEVQKIQDEEAGKLEQLKTAKRPSAFGGIQVHIAGETDEDARKRAATSVRHQYDQQIIDKYQRIVNGLERILASSELGGPDRERVEYARRYAQGEIDRIRKSELNTDLTGQKQDLETKNENAGLDRPFQDRMKALNTQLDGIKAKLAAIGQPEAAQVLARAFAEAQKAIDEVNKALERHHVQLTDTQKAQITQVEQAIASAEAEATWKTHLESTTTAVNDRIHAQELLTAAIGAGYEATKRANVETQLMATLGAHYGDSAWMQSHQADVAGLRTRFGQEYDAKHGEQVAATIDKLGNQVELEKSLAAVQAQGAEAVRQAELAYKLKKIAEDNDAESAKKLIQSEIDIYNATRANFTAAEVAKINEKITATERLTAAIFQGAEAQRKAANEAKYAEMDRQDPTGKTSAAQRKLDEAERSRVITEEAGKLVTTYQDQLDHLNQITAALEKQKETHGDTLAIEIALRDLENERLKLAVQQELKLRGAKDGLKAFFLEMQQDAKSAASIIYDNLNSALDKVSDQFAKLFTGQKTSFGKAFQSLGEEMIKDSTKSLMHKGLGELGEKLFHIHPPGTEKKPKGTPDDPIYVAQAEGKGATDALSSVPGLGNIANIFKSALGGIGGFLSKIFGGGGGLAESVTSTFTPMAEGGDVDPGAAYIVGEHEPEFFRPRTAGTITPLSKMVGGSFEYHIDARGADLGAGNRVARAVEAAHNSAVATSVRANAERARRTPQRS